MLETACRRLGSRTLHLEETDGFGQLFGLAGKLLRHAGHLLARARVLLYDTVQLGRRLGDLVDPGRLLLRRAGNLLNQVAGLLDIGYDSLDDLTRFRRGADGGLGQFPDLSGSLLAAFNPRLPLHPRRGASFVQIFRKANTALTDFGDARRRDQYSIVLAKYSGRVGAQGAERFSYLPEFARAFVALRLFPHRRSLPAPTFRLRS